MGCRERLHFEGELTYYEGELAVARAPSLFLSSFLSSLTRRGWRLGCKESRACAATPPCGHELQSQSKLGPEGLAIGSRGAVQQLPPTACGSRLPPGPAHSTLHAAPSPALQSRPMPRPMLRPVPWLPASLLSICRSCKRCTLCSARAVQPLWATPARCRGILPLICPWKALVLPGAEPPPACCHWSALAKALVLPGRGGSSCGYQGLPRRARMRLCNMMRRTYHPNGPPCRFAATLHLRRPRTAPPASC